MAFDKVIKKLQSNKRTLKELGIRYADIRQLQKEGYNVKCKKDHSVEYFYISQTDDDNAIIVSLKNPKQTEIMTADISDTHAGCKQFGERKLRHFLEIAVKDGFKYCHHSGDLVDGYQVYTGHLNNLKAWTSESQVEILANVLADYDLHYLAIKGNHDQSFEKNGGLAVGKMLAKEVPNFTYIDDVVADVVIEGVCKRLIHGSGGIAYAKSYPGQVYVRNLLDSERGHITVKGQRYRVDLIQMGHYHTDINFETAGIHIIHAGNFQGPSDYTARKGLVGPQGGRLTKMKVQNGHITEFESRFVKSL